MEVLVQWFSHHLAQFISPEGAVFIISMIPILEPVSYTHLENGKYPLVYIPGFLCKGRQHNNKGRRPKRTTCLQRLQKNEHLTEY